MYHVEGYVFENREMAKEAKTEAKGIKYIREQTDLDDPDTVLKLYNHLIEEDLFHTAIGIGFLHELQSYLDAIPYIRTEDIRPIPIEESMNYQQVEKKDKRSDYRKKYHVSLAVSLTLGIIIAGMFVVAIRSKNNVTILNYENAIIDKYEAWEQELEQREQMLDEKEAK